MAVTLTSSLTAKVNWKHTVLLDTGAEWSVEDISALSYAQSLAEGAGDSQADLVWAHYATLGDTATYAIDVNALSQTVLSSSVSYDMQGLKAIVVVNHNNTSAQTGEDIILTNSGVSNAQTDMFHAETAARLVVPAGGVQMVTSKVSEWASGSTKKGLELTNTQANTVTYSIAILGTSA